ncbi:DUF2953 domain-containing protein [Clostridium aestuarii]|uniref:DUF2953 domain-containing protein n=1 Tax=Clostridium aestuarii TaxID=338193 RepID=UPI003AEFC996
MVGIKIYPHKKKKKKIRKSFKKKKKISLKKLIRIIKSFKTTHSLFKPLLILNIDLIYGFNDAAITGITYGLLWELNRNLYNFLSIYFKNKKFKVNIKPNFNQSILEAKIKGIIFTNLVKIIYNKFFIFNHYKKRN